MSILVSLQATRTRWLALGAAFVFSLLSCGREITGPGRGALVARDLSFVAEFPGSFANVESGAGSVVSFEKVRVLFLRSDGSKALERVVAFGANEQEISLTFDVPLSDNATSEGEALALYLRYINAAGDTVFAGGPTSVFAVPRRAGDPPPQPAEVLLEYTGPGAEAVALSLAPDTIALTSGDAYSFTATARDADSLDVPDAPIVFSSLDPALATIGVDGSGGISLPSRGTATIRAALAAGGAEAFGVLLIAPRPDALARVGSGTLSTEAGSVLPDSVRVQLRATDGLGIAGQPVNVTIAGGGSTNDSTLVTDEAGIVAVQWTLGSAVGQQSLSFTTGDLPELVVEATATEPTLTATQLVITQEPAPVQQSGLNIGPALTVEVRDVENLLVTSYAGTVTLVPAEFPTEGGLTGTLSVNAVAGIATFDAWSATLVGTYRVAVTASGLTPDTTTAFELSPGDPTSGIILGGDGQTARVGESLPEPISIAVKDAAGNSVPGTVVQFEVLTGGGSLTQNNIETDIEGVASFDGWILGPTEGEQTLRAFIENTTIAVITAAAEPAAPIIQLSVFGSEVVGFERDGSLNVRLLQPAPAGGVTVTVVSNNTSVLTIDPPGSVAIAEGDTLGSVFVFGTSVGIAQVVASAPGYTPDTLDVEVSVNLISLPSSLNVPLNLTTSLPVQISEPAGPEGVWVALSSLDPAIARPTQDTVLIAAGTQTVNATIEGLAIGSTTIGATNPNYAFDATTVNVTAGVDITQASLALDGSFGTTMTVRLVSGGSPVAAPTGGITITLDVEDVACVSAPTTLFIDGGLISASTDVSFGGSASLPCSSLIRAIGPQGFTTDSVTASVNPVPSLTVPGFTTLGSGLQRAITLNLGSNRHGGTTVRLTAADSSMVLLSPNTSTPGSGVLDLPIGIGDVSVNFVVQAIEGFIYDSTTITAEAPGFNSAAGLVRTIQPVFELFGVSAGGSTITADDNFYIGFGTPTDTLAQIRNWVDEIRAGGPPFEFSVINDSLAVLDLVTQSLVADSITVQAVALQSNTPTTVAGGGSAIRFTAQGVGTIRATSTQLRPITANVIRNLTVTQPSISSLTRRTLGYGLQRNGSVSLSSAAVDSVEVTLTVDQPGLVLLSSDDQVAGVSDTLVVIFPPGSANETFYVQALEAAPGDTSAAAYTLTATAPGFTSLAVNDTLTPPVYELSGLATTATTSTADDAFRVVFGSPSTPAGTFVNAFDELRPGAPSRFATVVTDSVGIATLVTTPLTADSVDVAIPNLTTGTPTNVAGGGVAMRYLATGVANVRAFIAEMRPLAVEGSVTITQPSISALGSPIIGGGLQRNVSVSLSSPAPVGGVTVTIAPSESGVVLLAPDATTVGNDTIDIFFPEGESSLQFYVQALELVDPAIADTVTLTATAPGHNQRTSTVIVRRPVLELIGVQAGVNTLDADDPFYARIGTPTSDAATSLSTTDEQRAGVAPLVVTFNSSDANVARLVTDSQTGATVTVAVPVGVANTPTSFATGGVVVDPLTTGSTSITASAPGFVSIGTALGAGVTVSAPAISLSSAPRVGAGLVAAYNGSLDASQHGGITVTISSSNPSVALVAPNASTTPTASFELSLANGLANFSYAVTGVDGTTGDVTITASASGFTDGTTTASIVTPAVQIQSVSSAGTAGVTADDPFVVRVGTGNATLTGMSAYQNVRFGGSLTATITSSNPSAVLLVTNALPDGAASVTVTIPAGVSTSPTTVGAGGVAARFFGAGSSVLTPSIPGFVLTEISTATVTVSSP